MVEPVTVAVPNVSMPPPVLIAELSETVEPVSDSVPIFSIPPPSKPEFPEDSRVGHRQIGRSCRSWQRRRRGRRSCPRRSSGSAVAVPRL